MAARKQGEDQEDLDCSLDSQLTTSGLHTDPPQLHHNQRAAANGRSNDRDDGKSGPSSTSTTAGNGNSGLTVGNLSKVDQELHKYEEASHAPSRWLTFIKWVVGILLSVALTFCLVFSKISIINIGQDLYKNRSAKPTPAQSPTRTPVGGEEAPPHPPEATLAMLMVVLLVPLATRFLRALWCGGFSAHRPWPSWKALFAGVLASILESLGLALFVSEVIPGTQASINVSLMNGVFLAHAIYMLIQTLSRSAVQGRKRYCLALTLALSVGLTVTGILLALFCYHCGGVKQEIRVWAIPVSLVCLSVAWCSPLQRLQLMPRMSRHLQTQLDLITSRHLQASDEELRNTSQELDLETMVTAYPALSARWKATIITSILKMLMVPGFLTLFSWRFHQEIDLTKLSAGFTYITPENPLFPYLMTTLVCSFAGYLFGWLACTMSMQRLAFALPLTVATPIAFILTIYIESCQVDIFKFTSSTASCSLELDNLYFAVPTVVCLYLAQLLSTGFYVFKSNAIIMEKESQLFWLPGYNGAFLEQYMLLNKKTRQTDATQADRLNKAKSTRVFICTTMYREADYEMEQLLKSLGRINRAKQQSDRHFQAHIFFDNGIRHKRLTQFALQLVVVAGKTLRLKMKNCAKIQTPYGMQLRWVLPTVIQGKRGMDFVIHLKDNLMVKNKKRWSQVMYMSYVLDFHIKDDPGATDNNTLILTTDADVDFTPASVEALLDLMTRDDKVGAVCARTYPMGSGPVVWYQIFDYAIGHWFQKAANHVLGTVLCCPGCFSVYRAEALRHVLPKYATGVTHASEFLTKDMGEDRWLCTLLVQCGWRLEYSAAADNYTYCPEEFDEFFKQRRRWLPSTLANLALLLRESKTVYYFNDKISLLFLIYQALLLFSTLVSPAVCILVMSGGVYYAWDVSQYITVTLMYLITCGYVAVCLFTSPDMQLKVAKVLTVLGAFVMAAVSVGIVVQIVEENQTKPNMTLLPTPILPTNSAEFPMPISLTTVFLVTMVLTFVLAALLHLPEAYCLLHGVWYLWCLPVGFIILLTYSIANLTDRSWGTREEKTISLAGGASGTSTISQQLRKLFNCCLPNNEVGNRVNTQIEDMNSDDEDEVDGTENMGNVDRDDVVDERTKLLRPVKSRGKGTRPKPERVSSFQFHYKETGHETCKVSEWLPGNLRSQYAGILEDAGYDNTSFLIGMTDAELRTLGVKVKAHRQALLAEIRTLGEPDIEPFVPETIKEWLTIIELSQYHTNFRKMQIVSGRQLEILKTMSEEDIRNEIGILKQGHLKRLLLAIEKLRYPTESEMFQGQVKAKLELLPTGSLGDGENVFWTDLRNEKLLPTSTAFSDDYELKKKLSELRDSALVVFGVANTIWIILVLTLAPKGQLDVLGTNALGVCFLIVFGLVMAVQFFTMLIHRLSTFVHLIARAPPKCGDPYHINWSWTDNSPSVRRRTNMFEETLDSEVGSTHHRPIQEEIEDIG